MSVPMPPYGGSVDVSVAATTPGSACSRGSSASKNCCLAAAVLYCPRGSGNRATRMLFGFEAEIHRLQLDEIAHQQSGAGQQHQRQRHFGTRRARFAACRGEIRRDPLPESFNGSTMSCFAVCSAGTSPNTRRREHRDDQAEQQHRDVQPDVRLAWDQPSRISAHALMPPYAKRHPSTAPPSGQQQTLDEQLAHQHAIGPRRATPEPPSPSRARPRARAACWRHCCTRSAAAGRPPRTACTASSGTARRCCRPSPRRGR